MTFPMIKNTLKAALAAVAIAASSLFLPSTAQAETTWSSLARADGSLISIVVYLNQPGDFVQAGIIDFAYANNIDIMIEAAPGLVIQEVDGLLVAVAF
jgi:hypothetical protein